MPLGVVGFIYESRPNVTADAAALCVKSGNACVLRGGREALESNGVIAAILAKGLEKAGLPPEALGFIDVADREAVEVLITLDRYVDLIVPRGGEAFVRMVAERATIPILKHDKGLCHVYVDAGADLHMAADIAVNAKAQRPGVCNALETLLVHADAAARVPARGRPRASAPPAWSSAAVPGRASSSPAPGRRRRPTGTRSTSTSSWRSGSCRASTRRSGTSGGTARGWRRRS